MFLRSATVGLVLSAAICGACLGVTTAHAQYFGRNKVLYRTFQFKILRTEHFDVYYYPEEARIVDQAGRMAERWYARLSRVLGHDLSNRQALILYASHTHFEQTNAIPGELEEGTGGVTESLKRRIVLPVGASLAETDHVIGHELTHAFQYDMTGRSQGSQPAIQRLPLWFIEGMAEYMSIGPVDPHTAMWMRDAAYHNHLPTIEKLSDPHYFPYRFGHALWAYIGQRWGDRAVAEVMRSAARGGEVNLAFSSQLGMNSDSLSREWQRSLRALANQVPRRDPGQDGHALVKNRGDVGRYNLAPSVSPDGSRMMFLSERDLYTMDLYLADAHSGRILRKLTRATVDPHLQSLEFVSGSGAWSPDSRSFAFSTVRNGEASITVVNATSGRMTHAYQLPQVDEVLSLSWSPDGTTLAFSALVHGESDLYTLKLAGGEPERLTEDLYADLQPSWSPDGRTIAFSTERFSTNLDSLAVGSLRLATIEPATGTIRELPHIEGAKHINPQWSADGNSIYAVVDRGGISNVYRLDIASGDWSQVTTVSSGVSGITAYSPAFSVARDADRMVFAGYDNGTYNLYSVDSLSHRNTPLRDLPTPNPASLIADVPVEPPLPLAHRMAPPDSALKDRQPPMLIPRSRTSMFDDTSLPPVVTANDTSTAWRTRVAGPDAPRVATLIGDTRFGRTDTSSFQHSRYRPSLTLDKVSQVEVGFGSTGTGVAGVGGAALYWSDMLGDHNLDTYLQLSSDGSDFTRNIAAVADYTNLRSRLNWGFELSQLPYITRQITQDIDPVSGYLRQQDVRFWQTERRAAATIAYPFSRSERVEMSAGYQSLEFAAQVETRIINPDGTIQSDNTSNLQTGLPRVDLAVGNIAWVHDNSFFGGTSPIAGSRGRFSLEPVTGDLHYTGVLADWRSYLMPRKPWTIAVRGLHYGRYGSDAEAGVLSPLFLGYPNLVRGYDDGSFSLDEVSQSPTYGQLFGSRLAVGNIELRIPLVGAFGLFNTPGVPPVELAPFFDAGVAWNSGGSPSFSGSGHTGVTSQGLAMRANLFGFLIGELDYVHPNDRPGKSWYWQFSVQPGW